MRRKREGSEGSEVARQSPSKKRNYSGNGEEEKNRSNRGCEEEG